MHMPIVSVILTSYNHEKYLRESIESVLSQTFTDFELIIVDDCSTDRSWEIIESYSDDRIIKVRNPKNVLYVLNEAITNVVTGKYIAIHHSDDVWEPNKLAEQVGFLATHDSYGAVFSWASIVDEDGKLFLDESHFYYKIFEQPNRSRFEWLNFFFFQGNALCHPSVLIRKQCYDECGLYRYGLAQVPDLDMWMRLCLKYEIYVLPQKLIRFRIRQNEANASGNRLENRIQHYTEFYQLLENYLQVESFSELELIFPSTKSFFRAGDSLISFAFAMTCLQERTFPWVKLFGVNLLYELIKKPQMRARLSRLYSFSYNDLFVIARSNDLFSFEETQKLALMNAGLQEQIAMQNIELDQTRQHYCQLFVDCGGGFFEDESILLDQPENIEVICFDLSSFDQVQGIRFDPLNHSLLAQVVAVEVHYADARIVQARWTPVNAIALPENRDLFLHNDSQYIFFVDEGGWVNARKLCIRVKYCEIGDKAVLSAAGFQLADLFAELTAELTSVRHENAELTAELASARHENAELTAELASVRHENEGLNAALTRIRSTVVYRVAWRLRDILRKIKRFFAH